ncbi:hypothetical protein LZ554_000567 [Drepanopeziza brunnea f. sp. 'monogermtubi']|nr:hypothetical protein LZ554_000567 [Drepanopeziza brunnea f. sp. 'monogermtubi']
MQMQGEGDHRPRDEEEDFMHPDAASEAPSKASYSSRWKLTGGNAHTSTSFYIPLHLLGGLSEGNEFAGIQLWMAQQAGTSAPQPLTNLVVSVLPRLPSLANHSSVRLSAPCLFLQQRQYQKIDTVCSTNQDVQILLQSDTFGRMKHAGGLFEWFCTTLCNYHSASPISDRRCMANPVSFLALQGDPTRLRL